ncbi:uncharacterized protein LOC106664408 isoform X3 [Cimex lectularius]|uniref:Uncharacterized protein n=1 Tax=Cimex lectularius TaxID=79782 RepID=A0A8I6SQI6_CIMLE|nr:uncharacterized protein LOC106664408 isoform X3 [Cimex lectularius]
MTGVSVLRGGFTRGSRGVLVPSSRAASVHSSTSSTRSFSARQYERERENRLLAKARNRERDGNSPSPRSTENLIDDPLPSIANMFKESWPEETDGKDSEAFTPDVLEKDLSGSMPHIDDPLTMEADNTMPPPPNPPPYQDLN